MGPAAALAALSHDTASAAAALAASTVAVRGGRGSGGSGIVWPGEGVIVTNAHVVRGTRAAVHTSDGRSLEARVVARDDARDLAALVVRDGELRPAAVGDSDALRPGELVLAVGHPLGVPNALSLGIVHAVGAHPASRLPGDRRPWVQADVRLAPGNSGGPLADARGRVVGVNSMIAAGLALAVPSRAVERFLAAPAARPRLGVTTRPALVATADGPALGLAVVWVAPGGSAADAGVQLGDVLVGADGRGFAHPGELAALVADRAVGERVPLDLLRAGRRQTREVTLRASPPAGARAA